jgi:hypothetical protein
MASGRNGKLLETTIFNPLTWNLRGKGAFVWIEYCALMLVWSFLVLELVLEHVTVSCNILAS